MNDVQKLSLGVCYGLNCGPQIEYVETLTSTVMVFGDRAYNKIVKVTWGHKGGSLIQQD